MLLSYDDFKFYVGETICFCQTIENDVKWIYAAICDGDLYKNFNRVARWSLGKIINQLEDLDGSGDYNFLSTGDYDLLRDIKDERNYIAHEIFRDFLYGNNFEQSQEYKRACSRLMNFHNRIAKLYSNIEKIRINLIRSL